MLNEIIEILKKDKIKWSEFENSFKEKEIPSKTILLEAGKISNYIYLIKKGCLRTWFNKDGKDITFQFFFEKKCL